MDPAHSLRSNSARLPSDCSSASCILETTWKRPASNPTHRRKTTSKRCRRESRAVNLNHKGFPERRARQERQTFSPHPGASLPAAACGVTASWQRHPSAIVNYSCVWTWMEPYGPIGGTCAHWTHLLTHDRNECMAQIKTKMLKQCALKMFTHRRRLSLFS